MRWLKIYDYFYQLIKTDLKLVYKYLISMGAIREDAEDIIQNTLIKAYENIEILDYRKIKSWLFKVSLNKFYTLYKDKQRIVNIDDEILEKVLYDGKKYSDIDKIELKIEVQEVFKQMKDSQKTLLILKYYFELSCKDIALILDTDSNTIKTLLYRGRKVFKKLWEEGKYEK